MASPADDATMSAPRSWPQLPGGVGISHVRVYDTVGPDGLAGGTPHLHTVCTEAYLVIAGTGEVQTLSSEGFRATPLEAGVTVWFSPGTVHRLVNQGGLELFVVMSNAGLPEAGDLVVAFDTATLRTPEGYAEAWALDPSTTRRDRAVNAFAGWRALVEADPLGGMAALHRCCAAIVGPRSAGWSDVVEHSATAASRTAHAHVAAMAAGDISHLAEALVVAQPVIDHDRRWGCCGTLGVVQPPPAPVSAVRR